MSIFRSLVPQPVYQADLNEVSAGSVSMVADARNLPVETFSGMLPLAVFTLEEGGSDRVARTFADLSGVYVENIEIRDPYIAAGPRNMIDTRRFVKELIRIADSIEAVKLVGKEINPKRRDRRWEPARQAQEALERVIEGVGPAISVRVLEHRKAPNFHDRWVEAVVIDPEGVSHTLRYDLSGGIDHLLDEKRETKVFLYRVS